MPECDNCGAFVSKEWERVVQVDDKDTGCPECSPIGGAATPVE